MLYKTLVLTKNLFDIHQFWNYGILKQVKGKKMSNVFFHDKLLFEHGFSAKISENIQNSEKSAKDETQSF